MKILAVVVTYYPEKELLEKNVAAFIEHVDKVLIWENTPESEKLQYRFVYGDKIEYCGDGVNSISHGLNYGWHYAKNHGYDYLLTMDQDSEFDHFPAYRDAVLAHQGRDTALFGPQTEEMSLCKDVFLAVPAIITSGMLLSVELLSELGGYCEAFKIDGVDSELCLKASSHGFNVYLYEGVSLKHHFGASVDGRHDDKVVMKKNYSPSRLYGIFRNHIILFRRYRDNWWIKQIVYYYFRTYFIGVLRYDTNKLKKSWAMTKGIFDGLCFNLYKL